MSTYQHARHQATQAAQSATVEKRADPNRSISKDELWCINCTLEIAEDMKLPVYENGKIVSTDYVRIPHAHDLVLNTFELSNFCACSAPCALGFMMRHPACPAHQNPDLFHRMIKERHAIQEPTRPAPEFEVLQCANAWWPIDDDHGKDGDNNKQADIKKDNGVDNDTKRITTDCSGFPGLSAKSFYWMLGRDEIFGVVRRPPVFVPEYPDEHLALEKKIRKYQCSMYTDGLPEKVAQDFEGVIGRHIEDYPDSDTESDYATGKVHTVPTAELDATKKKNNKAKEQHK